MIRVGRPGIDERPHARAVELDLVDGLRRTDPLQLGRAIGGQHEHRHPIQVGLDDSGMHLHGGGPTRGQHHRSSTGGPPETQCHERRRALVMVHLHLHPIILGEGQCHRRGA